MKGYKGFNKDFRCAHTDDEGQKHEVQYSVGGTARHEGDVSLCRSGLHFCEDALDVLSYYCGQSRYAQVEASGVSDEKKEDSKRVCSSLKVVAEISLSALLGIGIKARLSKYNFEGAADKATGPRGAASATGDNGAASATGPRGAASATGYNGAASATGDNGAASATGPRGAASATGYNGAASATGDNGAASALGIEGRAMGKVGCWLILAEWRESKDGNLDRVDVQTRRVDGKRIKADTWYQLKKGKFVVVKS